MALDVEAHRPALNGSPSWNSLQTAAVTTSAAASLVASGELQDDLDVRRDVEELVANGEDQAADVGAADRGIKGIDVVQTDACTVWAGRADFGSTGEEGRQYPRQRMW
jgi:hypothetical protein